MASKKGAIEDTKKAINIARRGPEKEVLKLESVLLFLFWRGEGVRGDLAQAVRGGSPQLRRNTWRETSSVFFENRGF